jgi:hypothetical protein
MAGIFPARPVMMLRYITQIRNGFKNNYCRDEYCLRSGKKGIPVFGEVMEMFWRQKEKGAGNKLLTPFIFGCAQEDSNFRHPDS